MTTALPTYGYTERRTRLKRLLSVSLSQETPILPLIVVRMAFGLLMFAGILRFMLNGWVESFYLQPTFHFTYYGFGWIKPPPGLWLYAVYIAIAMLALGIALGAFYRISTIGFFLLFTYTELLDKSYYLNHYYFVSLFSFLLIFVPLDRYASLDSWRRPQLKALHVARWSMWVLCFQLGIVYLFAGVAKLEPDWLFNAMPLRIWLAANPNFPVLDQLSATNWFPYLMSWSGALYDLSIPFLLLNRRTRPWAYLAVIGFHVITGLLFPIGLFPVIMMACTLIFFDAEDYAQMLRWLDKWFGWHLSHRFSAWQEPQPPVVTTQSGYGSGWRGYALATLFILFFLVQLTLPLRHWLYPGNMLWTEQGFRFAWNVMLVEKTGHVTFMVVEPSSGRRWTIFPSDYLTYPQERQMSYQPDMILEFAHYLKEQIQAKGFKDVAVYAEAYVSLNGRPSQLLIDPNVDLGQESNSLLPKSWILPQNSTVSTRN